MELVQSSRRAGWKPAPRAWAGFSAVVAVIFWCYSRQPLYHTDLWGHLTYGRLIWQNGAIPDTAMRSPGQFDHPLVRRAKLEISAACHAHGKVPSHNVSTEVRDMSVVASDAARARNEFGYTRMWSIHPAQIEAIVAAFAPRDEEIVTATEILLAAQSAQWGPTRYHDTLHDRASYRYYWSVLRRAQSTGRTVPQDAAPLFTKVGANGQTAS